MRFCFSQQCKQEIESCANEAAAEVNEARKEFKDERSRFNILFVKVRDLEQDKEELLVHIENLKVQLDQQKLIPCIQCGYSALGPCDHPRKDPVSINIIEARERLEKTMKDSQCFVKETKERKAKEIQ